jgi:GT2 family glycosyltransferase
MIRVSFGIVFSNESTDCVNNFKSLLAAAQRLGARVQIVFNFAKPETETWVGQCLEDAKRQGQDFVVRYTQKNSIGLARQMIMNNSDDYVYMTDPDVEHNPEKLKNWLEQAFLIFQNNANLAAVGGNNDYNSEDFILKHAFAKLPYFFFLNLNSLQFKEFKKVSKIDHAPTCHVLYRKNHILSIGNFDDAFVCVGEDLDLSIRLSRAGHDICVLPGYSSRQLYEGDFFLWLKKCYLYGQAPILVASKNGGVLKSQRIKIVIIGLVICILNLIFFEFLVYAAVGYLLFLSLIFKNVVVGLYGFCTHLAYFLGAVKAFCHRIVFNVIAERIKAINIIKK